MATTHAPIHQAYREHLQRLSRAMLAVHGGNQSVLARTLSGLDLARQHKATVTNQSLQNWLDAVDRQYPGSALQKKSLILLAAYRSEVGSFRWRGDGTLIPCGSALFHPPIDTTPDEVNDYLWNGIFRTGQSIYSKVDELECQLRETQSEVYSLRGKCDRLEALMTNPLSPLQQFLYDALSNHGIDPTLDQAVLEFWRKAMGGKNAQFQDVDFLGILRGRIDLSGHSRQGDALVALGLLMGQLDREVDLTALYNLVNPSDPIREQNGSGVDAAARR